MNPESARSHVERYLEKQRPSPNASNELADYFLSIEHNGSYSWYVLRATSEALEQLEEQLVRGDEVNIREFGTLIGKGMGEEPTHADKIRMKKEHNYDTPDLRER